MSKSLVETKKTYLCLKPSLEIAKNPELDYKEVTETAGYLPLNVRLRQLEQQGYIAQFTKEQFDSDEISELWTNPDFEILPSDELEDVQEKLELRKEYLKNLLLQKAISSQSETEQTNKPEKKASTSAEQTAEE